MDGYIVYGITDDGKVIGVPEKNYEISHFHSCFEQNVNYTPVIEVFI